MPRLRRVSVTSPGYARRRAGRGWVYLDDGVRIDDPDVLERCRALAIPPAWRDVWICRYPQGHVQAFGYDDAGRGQYVYHPQWVERRSRRKFDHVLDVARALPAARRRVARDLDEDGMGRDRVLALAFRLLDTAYFRAGSESYARENASYGLATVRKEHASVRADGTVRFRYPAKSGQVRDVVVDDPQVAAAVTTLRRRRGDGDLLVWHDEAEDRAAGHVVWHDVTSGDVQAHVKELLGPDATPKDLRTWHATVLAAQALAQAGAPPTSERGRRAVLAQVYRDVAAELGNTPAVARSSYVDPRLVDEWTRGVTIARTRSTARAEREVLELLG
ncbi:DNA topoisomerase IB [Sediminihabitans luteus]|uniref:DNA topoisomerase n=1 Tax=Sediminihabitans luteus TaxID=1138585 RepID=A0A2M9CY39_9CELL|nr:DNA topoisomerase IB [Sediminihabitans luteus]PJJ76844.1 DNA topoisomerase IB [Sediminihabitans luteus]GIJ00323.1 DNA topoisomerase [Sediminihabitans luteus]